MLLFSNKSKTFLHNWTNIGYISTYWQHQICCGFSSEYSICKRCFLLRNVCLHIFSYKSASKAVTHRKSWPIGDVLSLLSWFCVSPSQTQCFYFFSLLIFQTFCYGAFHAQRTKLCPHTQRWYEFLPPHSQISSPLHPQLKTFSCKISAQRQDLYSTLVICLGLEVKTSAELDRPRPASQTASPQPLWRRAKMHQSLLILAAPERWSGLQFGAMSSATGPACCSTVWKHNAGILMDRTACPLSPMVIHTPHTHTHAHTRIHTGYEQARKHRQTLCTYQSQRYFPKWRPD